MAYVLQIGTGFGLATRYVPTAESAFVSASAWNDATEWGWLLRGVHAAGASFLMAGLLLHAGRSLHRRVERRPAVWTTGFVLYLLTAAAAFLGYVLPWGNMSFWAATVITGLAGTIPGAGSRLVVWLWGAETPGDATLGRFFALHFLVPLLGLGTIFAHLLFLHREGSSAPAPGRGTLRVGLVPAALWRDFFQLAVLSGLLVGTVWLAPDFFDHPENREPADPLSTPAHIAPDWYFLAPYAVLRSVPHKGGGALALILLIFAPWFLFLPRAGDRRFSGASPFLFWGGIHSVLVLSAIGARPAEHPYVGVGRGYSLACFGFGGLGVPRPLTGGRVGRCSNGDRVMIDRS